MNPMAKTHGMKADPLRYLWSKYECFLLNGWREILFKGNFNKNFEVNSTKMMESNKHTKIQMDE